MQSETVVMNYSAQDVDLLRLYRSSEQFREAVKSGKYIYLDGKIFLFTPESVEIRQNRICISQRAANNPSDFFMAFSEYAPKRAAGRSRIASKEKTGLFAAMPTAFKTRASGPGTGAYIRLPSFNTYKLPIQKKYISSNRDRTVPIWDLDEHEGWQRIVIIRGKKELEQHVFGKKVPYKFTTYGGGSALQRDLAKYGGKTVKRQNKERAAVHAHGRPGVPAFPGSYIPLVPSVAAITPTDVNDLIRQAGSASSVQTRAVQMVDVGASTVDFSILGGNDGCDEEKTSVRLASYDSSIGENLPAAFMHFCSKIYQPEPTFSDTLKLFMKERRISEIKLADELGISPRHLRRLRNGKAKPTFETLVALCIAMHLEPWNSEALFRSAWQRIPASGDGIVYMFLIYVCYTLSVAECNAFLRLYNMPPLTD